VDEFEAWVSLQYRIGPITVKDSDYLHLIAQFRLEYQVVNCLLEERVFIAGDYY
jgi:hypothetical protein